MRVSKLNLKLLTSAIGGAAALAAYALFVRPWHLRWGATEEELKMSLPGDGLVEQPKLNATHAITINAPIEDVWPWLVQVGQTRAGFYSYTWLENFVGCDMHNADQLVPEWQDLKVGDEVWLHPKAPPLKVLAIEPGRAIVLEKSWTFFRQPIDEHTTRLIIRGRGEFNPDLKNVLLNFILWRGIFEPAHFIMERKMMLGIKERAEATLTVCGCFPNSMTMKAWILNTPAPVNEHPLAKVEVPVPTPSEDELLLRVAACGICRTDLHVVEGELPVRRSPLIPGHQIVGRVAAIGSCVEGFAIGDRVGVTWLNRTCGVCEFCLARQENLCEQAMFTGWTVDGGYAEYAVAPAAFTYRLPDTFDDIQAAPLLCAGIIGYRCLRLTGLILNEWKGARLGLYGFGAAGHVCIQLARARGAEVYVCTRDRERHQALAHELGATWVGNSVDEPPAKLDASIIFAPVGELVPVALKAIRKGGTVVLGGIHMSPIPSFDYSLIYGERVVRSVANNTREDGREFLMEAAGIPVHTHTQTFSFDQANEALIALKNDSIRGAGVIVVD